MSSDQRAGPMPNLSCAQTSKSAQAAGELTLFVAKYSRMPAATTRWFARGGAFGADKAGR